MASDSISAALLRKLLQQKQQPPLDGPVMGAPAPQNDGILGGLLTAPPPAGGVLANALAQNPNKITPMSIADSIQNATGWRPGTTPEWVPDWVRNLSQSNTAAEQAGQQAAATTGAHGIPTAVGPDRLGYLMGFAGPVEAYHGSPHSFDAFDMSKIGTGEGAQAYGHGLYFAENEGVARDYRTKLAKGFDDTGGGSVPQNAQRALEYVHPKYIQSGQIAEGVQDAITRLKDQAEFYRKTYGPGPNLYDSAVEQLQNVDPTKLKPAGSMYQVRINAEPEQFLHWDKPLSEQSSQVRQAFSNAAVPNRGNDEILQGLFGNEPIPNEYLGLFDKSSGAQAYNTLAERLGGHPQTSQALHDAGIPGIRYLDQGSRGAADIPMLERHIAEHEKAISEAEAGVGSAVSPETVAHYKSQMEQARQQLAEARNPTHNYVVFSDKIIDILKKYGLAGLTMALGAGGLAAAAPGQAQASQPPELGR